MRSHLEKPAPKRDGDGMSPIVGPELINQVLNVEVDCSLGDRELIGDLFVPIAISNEPKDFQLPGREIVVAQVLGEASRHLGRDMPASVVDGADDGQQFIFRHALENVSERSRSKRAMNITITI